jgi:hypothetical protein
MRAFAYGLGMALCYFGCSDDGDGEGMPPASSDAGATSGATDELIAAFLKSACARPIECQDPNAGRCTPYERSQLEQGLANTTWTQAQIGQCATAREALVACLATAECSAVIQATACSTQKDTYVRNCDPLLMTLHPQ